MEDTCNQNSYNLDDGELVRLPSFDWDKVKFFYYIAKLKSFTEAAKFLNISQSSLSRKISILEDHLKFRLFTRVPTGVELTRKGEELFDIVEQYFISLKGFTYNISVINNGQRRRFRISTTYAIAAYVLNEHIISYNQSHPNILFEIVTNDQIIDLLINDVDLAIRPYDQEAKGVKQEHILTLEKKLFASVEYIEKYGTPKTVEDLSNHRIIAHAHPEKHPYSDIHWILRLGLPPGVKHQPVYVSSSLECLVKAAQNGLGIIGGYEEMEIIRNSGLVRILENIKGSAIEDYIIYPTHLEKDKIFQDFKEFLSVKLSAHNNKMLNS